MCWVALDRPIRLAWKASFLAPIGQWHDIGDTIYRDIMDHFWRPTQGAFVQHKETNALHASCLVMPLMRIVSPVDKRWLSTMRVLEKELLDDSLVYRYRGPDGFTGKEGTFCMCVLFLVYRISRSFGRYPPGTALVRKNVGLCQSPRALCGGAWSFRRTPR
jgi:GH15 family glucan-1,4-alpha-glucosidase